MAVLESYTTAGQFNVDSSGNLIQILSSGSLLYGIVQPPANSSVTKLTLTWETSTANAFGTFAFSGDALQWSVASITRPNLSAWLVCEDQILYINLGKFSAFTYLI